MSYEVALIDFPRLQEQIACRLLAEYDVNTHHLDHNEAAARLSMFNLALFFWPDKAGDSADRLKKIKGGANGAVPVVLVTSEAGRVGAESVMGLEGIADVLVTPLQPHIVSRKLAALLGIKKEPIHGRLDVAYISPFVDATIETLKQMAGMDCSRTGISARLDIASHGDISGTMGLSGPAEGFVSLTFKNELARKIVCKMLQIQSGEESEEDLRDGVGELMNMIAGHAKAELVSTDHSFFVSLPQVIVGGPHSVGQVRGVPVIVVEFETEGYPFELMVCLIPRRKA